MTSALSKIYINGKRYKVNLGDLLCKLFLGDTVLEGLMITSLDNCILKTKDGFILTTTIKETE